MGSLLSGPRMPNGLPIGNNGLPMTFYDKDGMPIPGAEVANLIQMGEMMEAIARKPCCSLSGQEESARAKVREKIVVVLKGVGSCDLADFDLQIRRKEVTGDFDLQVKKNNTPDDIVLKVRKRMPWDIDPITKRRN